MSLAVAGSNVGFDNFFGPGVSARDVHAAMKSYPVIQARQNSTAPVSNDTVNMFIDSIDKDWGYAASVIEACGGQTVLALQCTSAQSFVGSQTCGPNGEKATVTVNPTTYHFSTAATTSSAGHNIKGTAIEACSLQGTTAAICSVTIGGTVDGKKTSVTSQTSVVSPTYYRYDVAITGAAEKTAGAAATCTSAPLANAAPMMNAKNMMVWALAGVAAGIISLL
ncbi:uncharacterized protein RAG0_05707 [Rhynchosporium agropyri]|uniref:Uncharacterized protein n=1 Tax=Rhynchosporium agropyri TaxID=914238 RepID=A0A1E1KE61_9HELO|nr:uncharacterized protein RAG0_05707 [Rhynchosporium agropyri]